MTRTNKILIAGAAMAAAVCAFYFLALAPKREEIARLDGSIATKQAELDQVRQTLAIYEEAKGFLRVQLRQARSHRQGDPGRRRRPLAARAARGRRRLHRRRLPEDRARQRARRRDGRDGGRGRRHRRRPRQRARHRAVRGRDDGRDAVQLHLQRRLLRPVELPRAARAVRDPVERQDRRPRPADAAREPAAAALARRLPADAGPDRCGHVHRAPDRRASPTARRPVLRQDPGAAPATPDDGSTPSTTTATATGAAQ